jgi:hypothetical protein
MATSNASIIQPCVELTHTPLKILAPTQLITINGSFYWVTVVSKTAAGTEEFHHLDQEHWNALTTPIQRIFLANIRSTSDHKTTPLIERHPQLIEIPVSSIDSPIRYEKDANKHTLSCSEMLRLTAFQGHNLMQEVRQTLRGYPVTPYFSEDQNTATTLRLTALAQEYPNKHRSIHSLYRQTDQDIDVANFDFYRQELAASYQIDTLPISAATDVDLTNLNPTKPLFIPFKAHSISRSMKQTIKRELPTLSKDPHLLGVFIDPQNHEILVYDPNSKKKEISDYPDLEKMVAHLKQRDPTFKISYQGSTENNNTQVNRRLLCFFDAMIKATQSTPPSTSLRQKIQTWAKDKLLMGRIHATQSSTRRAQALRVLHTQLPSSLDQRCQTLAQEVQTRYNRVHEMVRVLGADTNRD